MTFPHCKHGIIFPYFDACDRIVKSMVHYHKNCACPQGVREHRISVADSVIVLYFSRIRGSEPTLWWSNIIEYMPLPQPDLSYSNLWNRKKRACNVTCLPVYAQRSAGNRKFFWQIFLRVKFVSTKILLNVIDCIKLTFWIWSFGSSLVRNVWIVILCFIHVVKQFIDHHFVHSSLLG